MVSSSSSDADAARPTLDGLLALATEMFSDESRPHRLTASRRDPTTVGLSIDDRDSTRVRREAASRPIASDDGSCRISRRRGGTSARGARLVDATPTPPRVAEAGGGAGRAAGPAARCADGPALGVGRAGAGAADAAGRGRPAAHFQHLLLVSEMWEKGARRSRQGVRRARRRVSASIPTTRRRGARSSGWPSRTAPGGSSSRCSTAPSSATGNAERAVRLLIDSARVREKQGAVADAEARYLRALGMQARRRSGVRAARGGLSPVERALGRAGHAARAAA